MIIVTPQALPNTVILPLANKDRYGHSNPPGFT